jgi:hypothetical protein
LNANPIYLAVISDRNFSKIKPENKNLSDEFRIENQKKTRLVSS